MHLDLRDKVLVYQISRVWFISVGIRAVVLVGYLPAAWSSEVALPVYRSDQIVDRSYDEVTLIGMNRMFIRWTGLASDRSDQIVDRSYDEVTLIGMNRMFIRWTGLASGPMGRLPSWPPPPPLKPHAAAALRRRVPPASAARFVIGLVSIIATSLKCRFPRETGRRQAPRRQQVGSGSATAFPTPTSTTIGNARCSSPSEASIRSHQQRDHIRGLLRAHLSRASSSRGLRDSRGLRASRDLRASRGHRVSQDHSSRGLLPLDLECIRRARRA
ncbi:hypothetical protein F511_13600 [Dorcoceras hygrometricum]|uniref:Uncharacterized protein n=1 Tax=Dorcoceras hygrometricum TaxID=472368 RepID=A0A2Z7C7Z1_9LAMI|nr:hypothetical protein F511_13600 [Dorcoceras hygrometricum]